MDQKILSLDLGSNSNGWLLRDTNESQQLRKFGVITFKTGVDKDDKGKFTISLAAQRTQKRSIRRLYQSRKYKLWTTLGVLMKGDHCPIAKSSLLRWKQYDKEEAQKGNGGRAYPVEDILFANWIKLDFNKDGKPDYSSPYQLRRELITEKLDFDDEENKQKLGRALYHIAQHRGFKSSKKVQKKDEDEKSAKAQKPSVEVPLEEDAEQSISAATNYIGVEIKRSTVLDKLMEKHGVATVGAAFAFEENAGNRIRQELHKDVLRKQLQDEVRKIFEFQELPIDNDFYKAVTKAIFWQRPLRSQKGTIGKCTLEPTKYRCPVSHPAFEEFRAWSFLNNIKYKIKGQKDARWEQIPLSFRQVLYAEKFIGRLKPNFDFYEIVQWIKKHNEHDNWDLNYSNKTNVAACPVTARLKDIFGDSWNNLSIPKPQISGKASKGSVYSTEDIWHVLFSSDDDEHVRNFAENILHDQKSINKLVKGWFEMPVDYGNLSMKAIRNILPFLRLGHIYTEAALLGKVPEILGEETWLLKKDFLLERITGIVDQNRIDKKHFAIVNNLIARYKSDTPEDRYADRNFDYQISDYEKRLILEACKEAYGEKSWQEKTKEEREEIEISVAAGYQSFFSDKERLYKKMPHLLDTMKDFLGEQFPFLQCTCIRKADEKEVRKCAGCRTISKLYHPSQIDIYPPAKSDAEGRLLLGDPNSGSLKNPMAMRALHELRKFINYLITDNQIDEQTRIVVELARELNDNNRRWAIQTYQDRRKAENQEFADAIRELIKDPEANGSLVNPDSDADIDKFRLWYERIEGADAVAGSEDKSKKFVPLSKQVRTNQKKGKEEDYEVFSENVFDKVNTSLYFKIKKGKDDAVAKYKLWKEQNCLCMYTGKLIGLTDLFKENVIDFEHTIPRSMSFDNRLENLTVCYQAYNRHVKKNQIPYTLPNYTEDIPGYKAIKPRLEKWEQKVKDLELHVEFWKAKSGRATDKEDKDYAIRQRHLWQFELDYWREKLERFMMKEVKSGFKNSQLVDTQIISKYALHYLKTVFGKIEVQTGNTTAVFRKIFGIQPLDERKDRSRHSHHAKDALVLSLIPIAAIREQMLELWYKIDEGKKLMNYADMDKRQQMNNEITLWQEQLDKLVRECRLPDVNGFIKRIDEEILINNIAKDQTLTPAKKRVRSRGKIVGLKDEDSKPIYQADSTGKPIQRIDKNGRRIFKRDENGQLIRDDEGNPVPVYLPKERWAKGDLIRGQLHKDSFLGAIRLIKKNEDGSFNIGANGDWSLEDKKYVIRENLVFKINDQSPGFKTLKEIEDVIIDKHLFRVIKQQIDEAGDFKEALKAGIWMLDKKGMRVNRIRRIRIEVRTQNALELKKQTYKSSKPLVYLKDRAHKESYWVENKERPYYAMYQKGTELIPETLSLQDVTKRKAKSLHEVKGLEDILEIKKEDGSELLFTLQKGRKVIFLKEPVEDTQYLPDYYLNTLYKVEGFEEGGRVKLQHHLVAKEQKEIAKEMEARGLPKQGDTKVNFENPTPWLRTRLYMTKGGRHVYNFAVEGWHFNVSPDGKIQDWKASV